MRVRVNYEVLGALAAILWTGGCGGEASDAGTTGATGSGTGDATSTPGTTIDEPTTTVPTPTTTGDPTTGGTTGSNDAEFWSRSIGDAVDQSTHALAPAKGGGMIVAGYSGDGPIDLGGVMSAGSEFLGRFAGDGAAVWVKDLEQSSPTAIATGPSGEIVVVINSGEDIDLGGGVIANMGATDVVVAKYEADGSFVWAKGYGDGETQTALTVAVASDGAIAVGGFFEGKLDFGGAPMVGQASLSGFVAHLDPNGARLWSHAIGVEGGYLDVSDVAFDSEDQLIIVGSLIDAVDFGDGPIPAGNANDVYVVKYGVDHSVLWKRIYDVGKDEGADHVVVGDDDAVYVTGVVDTGTANFGGEDLVGTNATNIFLIRLDAGGEHGWSRLFGAAECTRADSCYSFPAALTHSPGQGVIVSGSFADVIDLGGGPLSTPTGGAQGFAARFDEAGAHGWSRTIGGEAELQSRAAILSAADEAGAWLVSGPYSGELDLGHGVHTSAGETDIVLARLPWAG